MPEDQMTTAMVEYTPSVSLTLEQQSEYMRAFEAMKEKVLIPKRDYDTIPGTPKPTLLKPGAERLLLACGMTHRAELQDKIEDFNDGFFFYRYSVTVSKYVNGAKLDIASCEASANSKEKRYRNQDPYTTQNTLIKMAIKRALVGATLQATATSGLFTQDVEDMDLQQEQPNQNPERPPGPGGKVASEKSARMLYAVATKELSWTHQEFLKWLQDTFSVSDSKKLSQRQVSWAIDILKRQAGDGHVTRNESAAGGGESEGEEPVPGAEEDVDQSAGQDDATLYGPSGGGPYDGED